MMLIASAAVLSLLLVYTAAKKLGHSEDVVRSYAQAGVPERWLTPLALLLLAGATGLVGGLWLAPLGIAAAAALTLYFGVAVIFHVRAHDTRRIAMPVALALLSAISLVLRVL